MKLGSIIATNEALAAASPEEDLEAAQTATEVAEVAGEAQADEQKIEATDGAIADAEVTEDKIGELTEVAQDSLAGEDETVAEGEVGEEGDGLSEKEATLVEITHESLMASIGMPVQRTTYTRESFAGKAGRRQVTLEALENLKESAKKIGANILAALKAAWNTVSNFITGLLKNRALMERHLTNLLGKVKGMDASLKPNAQKVAAGGKAGGSAGGIKELLNNATTLIKACGAVAEAMKAPNMEEAVRDALKKADLNGIKVSGGRQVKSKPEEEGAMVQLVGNESATMTEGQVLTSAEMQAVLNQAITVIKELRSFEKTQSTMRSVFDNIVARVSEVYAKGKAMVAGKDGKDAANADVEVKKSARIARQLMSKVGGSLPGAAFGIVKSAADYVNASLNAYRPEGAKKADAAPAAAAA